MPELYHDLKIGSITLSGNVLFGPMAGVSDLPFRLLCHEMGASLTVSELISAKAIIYHNKGTEELLRVAAKERPTAIQLFGSDAACMSEALSMICDLPFDILDVNMGCPVPKVVKNGAGSALMKKPREIENIVRALNETMKSHPGAKRQKNPQTEPSVQSRNSAPAKRPVTVKMRTGMDAAHINVVECALAAEAGGAAAVCVHARTRDQYYAGEADWTRIHAVKEAVRVPVIGNGDIRCGADAARMMRETGCDGVMIARAARGNPWVFREVISYLKTGETPPPPTAGERLQTVLRHIDLMEAEKGPQRAVLEMRKHVAWYITGLPGAAAMRREVNTVTTTEGLREVCGVFFR